MAGLAEVGHLCYSTRVAYDFHAPETVEKKGLELVCPLGLNNMPQSLLVYPSSCQQQAPGDRRKFHLAGVSNAVLLSVIFWF